MNHLSRRRRSLMKTLDQGQEPLSKPLRAIFEGPSPGSLTDLNSKIFIREYPTNQFSCLFRIGEREAELPLSPVQNIEPWTPVPRYDRYTSRSHGLHHGHAESLGGLCREINGCSPKCFLYLTSVRARAHGTSRTPPSKTPSDGRRRDP